MPDQQSHGELVNELLSQDKGISESQFEEVRMKIEQTLNKAEQKIRRMRQAIYIAFCVLLVSYTAILPIQIYGAFSSKLVFAIWSNILWGSLFCIFVFSLLIFVKYRPIISQAQNEIQTMILSDLQRQIAELAKGLDKGGK